MIDYQIQANTRRCSATGRELRPGERFYTVLVDGPEGFSRKDFCLEAWQGPPADSFGFWSGRVPETDDKGKRRIDDELLFDCFRRLEEDPENRRQQFRYVVALLLMRSKRLRFETMATEGDQEFLCLRCPRTRTVYPVLNPRLSEEQMLEVQDEVFKILGWE